MHPDTLDYMNGKKSQVTSVRVDEALLGQIDLWAQRQKYSRAFAIRALIEEGLKRKMTFEDELFSLKTRMVVMEESLSRYWDPSGNKRPTIIPMLHPAKRGKRTAHRLHPRATPTD